MIILKINCVQANIKNLKCGITVVSFIDFQQVAPHDGIRVRVRVSFTDALQL